MPNHRTNPVRATLVSSLLLAVTASCASSADKDAMAGLTALQNCDLQSAYSSFSAAYSSDTSPDFAFAFALSSLAVLLEDPAFQTLAPRLGFTGPISTTFLWTRGGVLDQLSANESCSQLESYIRSQIPHPAAASQSVEVASTIDPTLTVGDVVATLGDIDARLGTIQEALSTAADGAGGGFTVQGGCGIGNLTVQAPELYVLAGLVSSTRAAIASAQAYDGSIPFQLIVEAYVANGVESLAAWPAAANGHFFKVTNAASLQTAESLLKQSVVFAGNAIDAAGRVTTSPAGALIDWPSLPAEVLSDLNVIIGAVATSLSNGGLNLIPFLTPALQANLKSVFDTPLDLSMPSPVIWTMQEGYVGEDWSGVESILATRFDQNPFNNSYQWGLPQNWSNLPSNSWSQTFDPQQRWTTMEQCQ